MNKKPKNKNARGSAAQFFVAGELCRREFVAVVTMGNTPNTDVLCSNIKGCLLYTSPSPRDRTRSRMPSSA